MFSLLYLKEIFPQNKESKYLIKLTLPEKDQEKKLTINIPKTLDAKFILKEKQNKMQIDRGHVVLGASACSDWTSQKKILNSK